MRHASSVAGRELRGLFVSPVAYAVLSLFAILAGVFFTVTAVAFNGYYVQDPDGDGDDATSDGMFVRESGSKPNVGDLVELTGAISESIPGGAGTGNLSTTRMSAPATTVLSTRELLPAPVVIGTSGRIPPNVDVIS